MKKYSPPWVRVVILVSTLLVAGILSYFLTGSILPQNPGDALIFQNAILLIVLGSTLLEYHFTKPADSLVNALTAIVTIIPVYQNSHPLTWWSVFIYCSLVLIFSLICVSISSGKHISGWQQILARITYRLSVFFGNARLLFSIVFLFAVLTFYGLQSVQTISLVIFWGFIIVIWPLGLPEFISTLRIKNTDRTSVGKITRTDWPNIIRVEVEPGTTWDQKSLKVFQQVDKTQTIVMPLYQELQGNQLTGTGLCIKPLKVKINNLSDGLLYDQTEEDAITEAEISESLGGTNTSKLIGIVVENSSISEIRFELLDNASCQEGMLVWCNVGNDRVYYQITNGINAEESFQTNRHGYQIAVAVQLGILDETHGFLKSSWLPRMNTPIFVETGDFGAGIKFMQEGDFCHGTLPGTKIQVGGSFCNSLEYHTAILGVTGSGKTELAFKLIHHAVSKGIKVICIDITARYEGKLVDLTPKNLSLPKDISTELGKRLFAVETEPYGAPLAKKALKAFSDPIRASVIGQVEEFILAKDLAHRVGIIGLEEISNTKATLWITELYLTCLLNYARDNQAKCPKILIVVEEAHTVMPEPNTMGLGDYDSRGLVSKIAQIALQGRKYGVGLLVVAQRTATVSKTVLTQCHTIISFNCYDDTSLNFLSNIFGSTYVSLIPNLPFLHAVVFGKGLRSQRPLIVQIPFDTKLL